MSVGRENDWSSIPRHCRPCRRDRRASGRRDWCRPAKFCGDRQWLPRHSSRRSLNSPGAPRPVRSGAGRRCPRHSGGRLCRARRIPTRLRRADASRPTRNRPMHRFMIPAPPDDRRARRWKIPGGAGGVSRHLSPTAICRSRHSLCPLFRDRRHARWPPRISQRRGWLLPSRPSGTVRP